jgi:Family of unknown function (DUF5309)
MAALIEPNQVGKREDLRDIMSVVDAKKYPVTSMAPKGMAPKNSLVEWLMDNYPAPAFDGVLDGDDVTAYENMASGRARAQARVQLFRRAPMVSLMAQEVSDVAAVGQRQEMAKAITKSIEMLKRDMECAFCSDHESQAQAGALPYLTRGLGKWIQNGAQTDLPVNSSYRTPTASIDTTATTSVTELIVNGVVQSVWDQTGEDKTFQLVCGRVLRSRFSTFTQYQTASTNVMAAMRMFTEEAAKRKITSTIDVLEGDFGTIELMPTHWNANESAAAVQRARGYLLDMDLLQILYHTPPQRKPLPDLGGGPREMVYAIASMIVKNPLGLGKFAATA